MLKKILLLLLLIGSFCHAQVVNIPDPMFKSLLLGTANSDNVSTPVYAQDLTGAYTAIDANHDGQIQLSEALNIRGISITAYDQNTIAINSLQGIQYFSNLTSFSLANTQITTADLSGLSQLKYLDMQGHPNLQSVNLTGLAHLELFWCYANPLLTTVTMAGMDSLRDIDLDGCPITALNVANLPMLDNFGCSNANFTSLDFTGCPVVKRITIEDSNLSSINVSGLGTLLTLIVSGCNLNSIDLSGLAQLKYLGLSNNHLTQLDLSANPALLEVFANYNLLATVDISSNTQVTKLSATNNLLTYANLKNGATFQTLQLQNNPLQMACISDNLGTAYTESMQAKFLQMGYSNIVLSGFCTMAPGGPYNTVSGMFKNDVEADGCGIGDLPVAFGPINVAGAAGATYFTDAQGAYTAFAPVGAYTLSAGDNNPLFAVSPGPEAFTFTAGGQSLNRSFCLSPLSPVTDLEIAIVPITTAQPGFDAGYQITYRNNGTTMPTGTITLSFNDNIMDFLSATQPVVSNSNGILTWNFQTLNPHESHTINVLFNINSPAETPPVHLGQSLYYTANITASQPDSTPADNHAVLFQWATGSFDPNDITCMEGSEAPVALIGDYLHYNINFENTGNASATFIVVEDQFDPAQFQVETFRMLSASHPIKVKLEGNKATFRFDNINLGPNEKGNVVFKIATKENLVAGNAVSNKADIFFDYNLPIETNLATTTFQVLGREGFDAAAVSLYPNPTSGVVNIKSAAGIEKVELYDLQGRLLQVEQNGAESLDLSGRAKGIYLVKISTAKGVQTEKIILE